MELKIINLGCMNGWTQDSQEQALYNQHVANCGCEKSRQLRDGRVYTFREYNTTSKNLGLCYNEYTCQDCGINYSVDSSG